MLDTVGLVAVWDVDDQWHTAAAAVFDRLRRDGVKPYCSTFVLAEAANAAARRPFRGSPDRLRAQLEAAGTLIAPSQDDWDEAWILYRREEAGGAGLVDCLSFAVMRRLGITRAFTNDRHFRAAGFEVLF